MIVYKAISPFNKIYIGITTCSLEKRMKEHFQTSKRNKDNYKFYNSIRKYGFHNFKWEIIDQDGNIYKSVIEACEKLNIPRRTLYRYFKLNKTLKNGLELKYA